MYSNTFISFEDVYNVHVVLLVFFYCVYVVLLSLFSFSIVFEFISNG